MSALLPRLLAAAWFALVLSAARADDFDGAPIHYRTAAADNAVSRLQERLDGGKATLTFEERFGYLRSVLRELGVPESSQALVFSKTSL